MGEYLDKMEWDQGLQFGTQLISGIIIMAWSLGWSVTLFYIVKHTVGIRVADKTEKIGIDIVEHGHIAYAPFDEKRESDDEFDEGDKEENSGSIKLIRPEM